MRPVRPLIYVAAAVAGIVFSACGQDKTPPQPSPPQPSPPAAGVAPEVAAPTALAVADGPVIQCTGDSYLSPKTRSKAGEVKWDHQFWCLNAPSTGRYAAAFKVAYADTNLGDLVLDSVSLEKVTPRPLERVWDEKIGDTDASFSVKETFPIILKPGDEAILHIEGKHLLDKGDEKDMRANLHYEVFGTRAGSKQAVMGFSVHILSSAKAETDGSGPPAHRGGAGSGPDQGDRGRGRNKHR